MLFSMYLPDVTYGLLYLDDEVSRLSRTALIGFNLSIHLLRTLHMLARQR